MAEARQEFPVEQQLRKDMQEAQRSRDQLRLDTLRMALGAIHNLEVARTDRKNPEFGKELTEADCYRVLEQEIKKRNQAIELYKQARRDELVVREQREAEILQGYLAGAYMSEAELRALIADLIAQHGKEFKAVMPLAARATRGKADGKAVNQLVREMTQSEESE
ncbi:MAG TPA: GatB/YqeY domain-containing protein [Ktedonobacteraceae bacterium]|nr:GatB/YqeY domain-containing protein [Ktedonobacteraceae bacterium]